MPYVRASPSAPPTTTRRTARAGLLPAEPGADGAGDGQVLRVDVQFGVELVVGGVGSGLPVPRSEVDVLTSLDDTVPTPSAPAMEASLAAPALAVVEVTTNCRWRPARGSAYPSAGSGPAGDQPGGRQ
jgi:hypothetical protein